MDIVSNTDIINFSITFFHQNIKSECNKFGQYHVLKIDIFYGSD